MKEKPSGPKYDALNESIAEAERFLARAKAARAGFRTYVGWQGGLYTQYDSPLYAAAKRASMDLTRSLARLRGAL